ncbi:MAG: site-2 protease family protein [Proteobacteria bacterium]|nr:site-2 protease family protein [Pseudomonadota bacterium]NOG61130.1 site-2 protease family protein [Pseudomonadota bacterium]
MSELPILYQIFIWAIPVLFAVTLHEVGHGWVANQLGDSTAKELGRLTVNPLKHIDPVGTIIVPLMMFFASGFIFGWAKPVPVNWDRLRNTKRDIALVALAGPAANLVMILFWLVIAKVFIGSAEQGHFIANIFTLMAWAGIMINSLLMILNLFPLPPLDGSRVVFSLLPSQIAYRYAKIEPYGLIILVVLLVSGTLFKIIGPIISWIEHLMYSLII